jgi:hypothetical protein
MNPASDSAIRSRLQYFLRGHLKINRETSRIVVQLDRWVSMVLTEGFDTAQSPGTDDSESLPDVIREIADYLAGNVKGLEGDVQRKSLQEALFFALGMKSDRVGSRSNGSLAVFLRRNGRGLLRRFLRLHLFNIVWLETSESFRPFAQTNASFVQDMERVERTCQKIVDSAWRSQKIRGTLNQSSAEQLINRIELLINSEIPLN